MIVLKSCKVAKDSMSPRVARLGFFVKAENVFILASGENAVPLNLLFVSLKAGILTVKPYNLGGGDFHLEVSTVPKLV